MPFFKNSIIAAAAFSSLATAHYANMGMDGVSCYIYNGIKGTTPGHMIVRNANGTWYDNDDAANHGDVTVIHSQKDYDNLEVKTKVGIVCAPDDVDSTGIGIPYVEMEPTDEDFYSDDQTVYTKVLGKRFEFSCVIKFCRSSA